MQKNLGKIKRTVEEYVVLTVATPVSYTHLTLPTIA